MKEKSECISTLEAGAEKLGLHLHDEAVDRLYIYFRELRRWNRKMNLIAKGSSGKRIIENHFLDSLTLLPFLKGSGTHLLDVGSGAGFPGLVCGAAALDVECTLVEPRLKKVSFLRHIIRSLHLENVNIIAARIEDVPLPPPERCYTHITSRAVADMAVFLEMISPFVHSGATIICMRGARWREEARELAGRLLSCGLESGRSVPFRLPFSGADRALLFYHMMSNPAISL